MEGPLNYKIVSFDGSEEREVHVDFKREFQNLKLDEQVSQFEEHISSLHSQAAKLPEESPERQGIVFVLEFLEELAPRIKAGELPLHETVIVKVMEQPPLKQLISKLEIN